MSQQTVFDQSALHPLPKPEPWSGGNKARLLGAPSGGSYVEPLDLLSLFDDTKFERFVLQWADEYLTTQYNSVEGRGGAGDKGRDVVAWLEPKGTSNRQYDNYQCKHYDSPLMPSQIWSELAKLCHYSFTGEIAIPKRYVFVTSKGIGSKLMDLIGSPVEMRKELIKNWKEENLAKAGKGIPKRLEGDFKKYVETFDFSIVEALLPEQLIKQHAQTTYHALVFGITVQERKALNPPDSIDEGKERIYIKLALEAYADSLGKSECSLTDLDVYPHLKQHLKRARVCFYSAESLKEFSRDSFPDDTPFEELLNQFDDGVNSTYSQGYANGYVRMLKVCEVAAQIQIDSGYLKNELKQADRTGMCHHLANEGRIPSWLLTYYGTV
jgi:hypothetical protein